MDKQKRKRLERAGWRVGDTQEFLGLSDIEMTMIDVRISLAADLRRRRKEHTITQSLFADQIGSSQSRVAKMEAGDNSVSIDLLIRSLIHAGASVQEIGQLIANATREE